METTNVNIPLTERRISTVLGGLLLLGSLPRRSLGGITLASALLYRGVSGHSYLYQLLGAKSTSENGHVATNDADEVLEVERSITIGKSANELSRLLHEPQAIARIMGDFAEVSQVSNNRMRWVIRGPLEQRVEWETQVVEDRPGEVLRWKSLDGAVLPNENALRFRPAPDNRGTEVTLRLNFDLPGGALGTSVARRLKIVPRLAAEKALRHFKSLAEAGEIPTLKHNPAAYKGTHEK